MHKKVKEVLDGDSRRAVIQGDSLKVLRSMPPGSVDLIFGSPPYEDARTYGELGFAKAGEEWVAWMVEFFRLAVPVTKGMVALVVGHGKTFRYKWSAAPAMLMADLHRAGFQLRCPPLYTRVGIPGSGGVDYFRNDYEFVVCVQNPEGSVHRGRGGPQLPWANNVACGHPPVYGPGGEMSCRTKSGRRVNQWGGTAGHGAGGGARRPSGERMKKHRPSHKEARASERDGKTNGYVAPVLANPGTVADEETYTASEVREMLSGLEGSLVAEGAVGGNKMGHSMACDNEAPFPLWLAERFVLSFCPPGGVVLDPFCGGGTTIHAAIQNKRRGIGIDMRQSQVELANARLDTITPLLFVESDEEYQRRMEAKGAQKTPLYSHAEYQARQKARRRRGVAGAADGQEDGVA
jgi:hypothetical protein